MPSHWASAASAPQHCSWLLFGSQSIRRVFCMPSKWSEFSKSCKAQARLKASCGTLNASRACKLSLLLHVMLAAAEEQRSPGANCINQLLKNSRINVTILH